MKQFLDILYSTYGKSNPDAYVQFDIILKGRLRVCLMPRYISLCKNGQNSEICYLFPSYYIEIDS